MVAEDFYRELREWSRRKHHLLTRYLTPFVRILGGSRRGIVYYVDGFAGPGIYYEDGSEGSPVLAAKYAASLREEGKYYGLHCINVEPDPDLFSNLEMNTRGYDEVTTNYQGGFGQHVRQILDKIAGYPALFFLDPFGIKGVEWRYMESVLRRAKPTDVLARVDSNYVARLMGFSESAAKGAEKKVQALCEFYGFPDPKTLIAEWKTGHTPDERRYKMVGLYLERLVYSINIGMGAFAAMYPIRAIGGPVKYHMVFATRHRKAAVVMSDIVYDVDESYEREVEDYREQQSQQPTLPGIEPSENDIFREKVRRLKEDLAGRFGGRTISRLRLHAGILNEWFGRIKSKHLTRALKELEETGIVSRDGPRSKDRTQFTFRC